MMRAGDEKEVVIYLSLRLPNLMLQRSMRWLCLSASFEKVYYPAHA